LLYHAYLTGMHSEFELSKSMQGIEVVLQLQAK